MKCSLDFEVGHEVLAVYSFFFMQIMRVFAHSVQHITGSSDSCHWRCMTFSSIHQRTFLHVRGVASTLFRSQPKIRDPINFASAGCQMVLRCCRGNSSILWCNVEAAPECRVSSWAVHFRAAAFHGMSQLLNNADSTHAELWHRLMMQLKMLQTLRAEPMH